MLYCLVFLRQSLRTRSKLIFFLRWSGGFRVNLKHFQNFGSIVFEHQNQSSSLILTSGSRLLKGRGVSTRFYPFVAETGE
uniref:Putative secreted protein n=1 Tax=Ixodes ricinus TaxID=34613 RepID=A0A6B0TXW4_IXORI